MIDKRPIRSYYIQMVEGIAGRKQSETRHIVRRTVLKTFAGAAGAVIASIAFGKNGLSQKSEVEAADVAAFDVTKPIVWGWVRTEYPASLPGMSDGADYRITENIPVGKIATITGGRAEIFGVSMPFLGQTPAGRNRLLTIIFDPGATGGDFDVTLASRYNIRKDMSTQNSGRSLNEMEVRALQVDAIEHGKLEQNGETFRFCHLSLETREMTITPEMDAQQTEAFLATWKERLQKPYKVYFPVES